MRMRQAKRPKPPARWAGARRWSADQGGRPPLGCPGRCFEERQPLPHETEPRLVEFAELFATAIANSEAHERLAQLAEEQAALRRVATLVAEGATPASVFDAVRYEVARMFNAPLSVLLRCEANGTATVLATSDGYLGPLGRSWPSRVTAVRSRGSAGRAFRRAPTTAVPCTGRSPSLRAPWARGSRRGARWSSTGLSGGSWQSGHVRPSRCRVASRTGWRSSRSSSPRHRERRGARRAGRLACTHPDHGRCDAAPDRTRPARRRTAATGLARLALRAAQATVPRSSSSTERAGPRRGRPHGRARRPPRDRPRDPSRRALGGRPDPRAQAARRRSPLRVNLDVRATVASRSRSR